MLKQTVKNGFYRAVGTLTAFSSGAALADAGNNPFPDIDIGTKGDVVQATGTKMELALKYGLVGGGGLLILICLAVIIHRIRDDSRDRDHGNLVMTYILLALGLTIGFVLIALGWKAFSTQVQ